MHVCVCVVVTSAAAEHSASEVTPTTACNGSSEDQPVTGGTGKGSAANQPALWAVSRKSQKDTPVLVCRAELLEFITRTQGPEIRKRVRLKPKALVICSSVETMDDACADWAVG